MRILSPGRGNPDTEVGRSLTQVHLRGISNPTKGIGGRPVQPFGEDGSLRPLGSRIGHSTQRAGEPSTGGRTRREPVARKGNVRRIRQAGKRMLTSVRGIANKARQDPHHRFRNLFGLLNEEGVNWCWESLNKKACSGVDGVTASEYAADLAGNIARLAVRVKEDRYKALMREAADVQLDLAIFYAANKLERELKELIESTGAAFASCELPRECFIVLKMLRESGDNTNIEWLTRLREFLGYLANIRMQQA